MSKEVGLRNAYDGQSVDLVVKHAHFRFRVAGVHDGASVLTGVDHHTQCRSRSNHRVCPQHVFHTQRFDNGTPTGFEQLNAAHEIVNVFVGAVGVDLGLDEQQFGIQKVLERRHRQTQFPISGTRENENEFQHS